MKILDNFISLDPDKVRAFHQLVVDGSFSKAALNLGISQSGLSQKIAKLEDELEGRLIIRTTKEFSVTDLGLTLIRYYNDKKALDQEYLNLIKGTKNSYVGEIRISGYSSITRSVLLPIIAKVIKNKPHDIPIKIFSKEIYELHLSLLNGESDFIISLKELNRENVINEEIAIEENVHIIAKNTNNSELPFLDHDENDTTTFDFLKLQGKKIPKIQRSYFDDIYNIIEAVELGLGQAIVSKHLIQNNTKVKIIPYKNKMCSKVYLTFYDRMYFSKIQKDLLERLRLDFKKYL